MKCNHSRPGFELVSPCSSPTTITLHYTITPQVRQFVYLFSFNQMYNCLNFNDIYFTIVRKLSSDIGHFIVWFGLVSFFNGI